MTIYELIALRDLAKETLYKAHDAYEVEQLCEFYAAAAMAVQWYNNEVLCAQSLDRLYIAYDQPLVRKYIDLSPKR